MAKPMRAVAAAAVVTALAACVGGAGQGSFPQRYDLGHSPTAILAAGQPARAPIVLAVSAASLPVETAMIWRTEDSLAPQAYVQARWAVAPAQLVRQRLVDRLAPGGAVLSASVQGATQLVVTLTVFEQVFAAGGGRSEGRVTLEVVLLRENRVVGSTQIQTAAPAPTQDALGGVAALRQATAQAADKLAMWLDARVSPLRQ